MTPADKVAARLAVRYSADLILALNELARRPATIPLNSADTDLLAHHVRQINDAVRRIVVPPAVTVMPTGKCSR